MWNFSTTKWADVLFYGMPHFFFFFFFSILSITKLKNIFKKSTGASG
jgi:hypothetical protein